MKNGLQRMFMYDADLGGTMGGVNDTKVEDVKVEDVVKVEDTKVEEALTLDSVKKMIQSETDKVRGEYSKKLKDKEKELDDVRMASMSDAEREAEQKKTLEKNLSERESQLLHKELTLGTIDMLKESNLPIEFKDFLIGKDSDSTKANVDKFQKVFNAQLEAMVTERFKATGKEHVESSGQTGRYTMSDVEKMSSDEINANFDKIQRDLSGQ